MQADIREFVVIFVDDIFVTVHECTNGFTSKRTRVDGISVTVHEWLHEQMNAGGHS